MDVFPQNRRLPALDAMRGLIMVLMALDHASFFVAKTHSFEFWGTALPEYESSVPFILRAVTHLCAPGFFLLMGIGMELFITGRARHGWSRWRVSRFFLARGFLLIVIQQILENPAWYLGSLSAARGAFTFRGGPAPGGGAQAAFYLGVLYALGSTAVIWGLLFRLPSAAIMALSAAAIGLTQVVVFEFADPQTLYHPVIRLLLIPGHTDEWMVLYPTIPWMGITGFGMVLGRRFKDNRAEGDRCGWISGAGMLVIFAIIRLLDGSGNLNPTAPEWVGFFNPVKYPPDLAFLLLTTGVNLLCLQSWVRFESRIPSGVRILAVFGRVPLFFYIVHLYVYACMGWAFPYGMPPAHMIIFWLAGLLILYPVCFWYGRFRRSRPTDSVWRFL